MSQATASPSSPETALADWEKAVTVWLDDVEHCVVGRLMPQEVAQLRQRCMQLEQGLAALGPRGRKGGYLRRPGPAYLATTARRVSATLLPALKDRILSHFPIPGAAGLDGPAVGAFTLPAAVDLLDLLEAAVNRLFQGRADGGPRQHLCKALVTLCRGYHRRMMDGFRAEDPDLEGTEPIARGRDSIRNANFDQMRMELVQWTLAALQDRRAAVEVRQLSKITARTAVRRVDRDLLAYLNSHDPETRARLRPVLEAVDEVMALLRAVLRPQDDEDGEAAMQHFVRDLGAEVSHQFIHHMGMLVIALFEDLETAAIRRSLSEAALRVALQRVEEVLHFCQAIDHPLGRDAHARAIRVVRVRSDILAEEMERWKLELAVAEGAADGMQIRLVLVALREFVERRRVEGMLA